MGLYAIKQQVPSGSNFTGVAPDGTAVEVNGVRTVAWGTVAGLFELPTPGISYDISAVLIKFGGQTNWVLEIVDGAYSMRWMEGTTDNEKVWAGVPVTIPPGAKLKLTTTGTPTANMQAAIFFSPSALGNT